MELLYRIYTVIYTFLTTDDNVVLYSLNVIIRKFITLEKKYLFIF